MEGSKITIYFLKMSFQKSLFSIIGFARNAKSFAIFTCIFSTVCEDVHKK